MELVPVERITPTNMTMEMGLLMILSPGASAPRSIQRFERRDLPITNDEPAES